MNCKKCGTPLTENDQFCKNCGAPVNEVSAQQNYGQSPKNSTLKFVLIFVGIAVIIAAVIIAVAILSGNKEEEDDVKTSKKKTEIVTTDDEDEEEEDEVVVKPTTNTAKSTYTVKYEGFEFKIPTDLVYETDTDGILIGDEEDTWVASIGIFEGAFKQMQLNKNQLQSSFQQEGYVASSAVEKTIKEMPFITIEVTQSGENILIGYTKANSMYIYGVSVVSIDNEFDYEVLEKIANILSNAEFIGETTNMNAFESIDMSIVSNLAQ